MVVNAEGLLRRSKAGARRSQPLRVRAIETDEKVDGLIRFRRLKEFIRPLQKFEDMGDGLEIGLGLNIREIVLDVVQHGKDTSHAVPIRPHMAANRYSLHAFQYVVQSDHSATSENLLHPLVAVVSIIVLYKHSRISLFAF